MVSIIILYYNLMEPPSCVRSVVDRNVVMRCIHVQQIWELLVCVCVCGRIIFNIPHTRKKTVSFHAIKTCSFSRSVAPPIFNLDTKWRLLISFTRRPFNPHMTQSQSGTFKEPKNILLVPEIEPCTVQPILTHYGIASFTYCIHTLFFSFLTTLSKAAWFPYIQGVPGGMCNTSRECSLC